jgi:MFS family permease
MGFGAHDVITLSMVARWFVKRRGMMSGIVKVGTGTGQLLIPMIIIGLIKSYGWRDAYIVMGTAAAIIFVAASFFLRRDPAEMDLMPDGRQEESAVHCKEWNDSGLELSTALKSRQFWILCLGELVAFSCLLTVVVHVVPHATDLGLNPDSAGRVISIIGGTSMIGRIIIGTANDKAGAKPSLFVCFSVLLLSLIWLQFADEAWMLFLFGMVCGFAHGGFFTVMSPSVAEFFGTKSHGVLFGIVLFWGTLGGAIGPLVAGHVFDVTGNYRGVFMALAGAALLGLAAVAMLGPLGNKDRSER